jgi:hypothetical protein
MRRCVALLMRTRRAEKSLVGSRGSRGSRGWRAGGLVQRVDILPPSSDISAPSSDISAPSTDTLARWIQRPRRCRADAVHQPVGVRHSPIQNSNDRYARHVGRRACTAKECDVAFNQYGGEAARCDSPSSRISMPPARFRFRCVRRSRSPRGACFRRSGTHVH